MTKTSEVEIRRNDTNDQTPKLMTPQIVIGRVSSNPEIIRITVHDYDVQRFIEIDMIPTDFANAITGKYSNCKYEILGGH
jgi:hypothetical protein